MTSYLHESPDGVPTFPTLSSELLVFLALLRQEIQAGPPERELTAFALNGILERSVGRYLDGERL